MCPHQLTITPRSPARPLGFCGRMGALLALAPALLALVLATPAQAQWRIPGVGGTLNPGNYYDPYGSSRQAAYNIRLYGRAMSQVPPYALGYNPYVYYPPTWWCWPPSPPVSTTPSLPSSDPSSGFLQEAASVIAADGHFRISNQQANLVREQVRSAHSDNNRKAFDEFLYERGNTPTWLDDLERQRKLNLRYALSGPSGGEILAGTPLNTLLDALKQMPPRGEDVALPEGLLKQINVTAGAGANPALLKTGQLTWPVVLSGPDYDNDRRAIEHHLGKALEQAKHHPVDRRPLETLKAALDRLETQLDKRTRDLTPSDYIEGRHHLRLLGDAARALSRPDARNYFTGEYAAKGRTVGELVKNMSGLRFAAAAPGNEKAYRELYDKLVTYYNRAQPSPRER
jgi:hypothetical protein